MTTLHALPISLGLVALAGAAAPGETRRFVQDRFAIGFWVDPPMDARADFRYRRIAEANFTLVLGGFGARTPVQVRRQLELCEKYGLKALVNCGGNPADLPSGPACWGYRLKDEPSAAVFKDLRQRADVIRAQRPGKLVFVNLYPNYANGRQLGVDTYEEHVALFCETYDPAVLSMDHYPGFRPDRGDGRANYCANLAVMRKFSLQRGIPFWNFFNIMPYGGHTDPTEGQVRWQIYASLAYGAKGVLYFCYYTPRGREFPKGGAIIGRDDRPTRHYDQARRINAELKALGPTLMRLISTDVRHVAPGTKQENALAGTPIRRLERARHDPEFDLLVGCFRHADGRRAVLLVNYRFAYTAWPTVEFDAAPGDVVEIDKKTGREVAVIDDSPAMPGFQISLDAGDGRLFLLPAAAPEAVPGGKAAP